MAPYKGDRRAVPPCCCARSHSLTLRHPCGCHQRCSTSERAPAILRALLYLAICYTCAHGSCNEKQATLPGFAGGPEQERCSAMIPRAQFTRCGRTTCYCGTSGCSKLHARLRGGKGDWFGGIAGALSGSLSQAGEANQRDVKADMIHSISQTIKKWERFRAPKLGNQEEVREKAEEVLPAIIRMFSGCRDDQTSADVADTSVFGLPQREEKSSGFLSFLQGPDAGGACTSAMMLSLSRQPRPTWIELLDDMRRILCEKSFSQVPQLSSSREIQLRDEFFLKQPGHRTKALFIGINYVGHKVGELRGCHNDIKMMRDFVGKHGYDKSQMMVLMDDGKCPMPTCQNIFEAFRWLVDGAQAGDSLFLHFSGHGGQIEDDNGDEADGFDETILPVDYQTEGMIRDDTIFELLCAPLPEGSMLTVVMDCCHSGTALDLPYTFACTAQGSQKVHEGVIESLLANPDFNWEMAIKIVLKVLKALQQKGEEAKKAVGEGVLMLKEKGDADVKEFSAKMQELQAKGEHDTKLLMQAMQELLDKADSEAAKTALIEGMKAVQDKGKKDVKMVMDGMRRAWERQGKQDVEKFVAGVQDLQDQAGGLAAKIGDGLRGFLGKK